MKTLRVSPAMPRPKLFDIQYTKIRELGRRGRIVGEGDIDRLFKYAPMKTVASLSEWQRLSSWAIHGGPVR